MRIDRIALMTTLLGLAGYGGKQLFKKVIHIQLKKEKGRFRNGPAFFIIHISIRNHCVFMIDRIAEVSKPR